MAQTQQLGNASASCYTCGKKLYKNEHSERTTHRTVSVSEALTDAAYLGVVELG
jgi:hypothetical protein